MAGQHTLQYPTHELLGHALGHAAGTQCQQQPPILMLRACERTGWRSRVRACAQVYHQFHDGIGHPFPAEYKRDQKDALLRSGRLAFTGCPE